MEIEDKMKKFDVATISYTTHSRHLNYGATLHGWAFQQILLRMGCSPVVIAYLARTLERHHFKWPVVDAICGWRNPIAMIRHTLQWLVSTCANLRKYKKFQRFISERLICTDTVYTEKGLSETDAIPGCDDAVFVCEADVIWNCMATHGIDKGFFLDFPAAANHRKVAYAPTVSRKPFSFSDEAKFIKYLRSFDAVSAREREGARYIKYLTGLDVEWLVDPSLLLSADDYAAIAKPFGESGYILLYTCMKLNVNMVREARALAKRMGKKLVEVGNYGINRYLFGHTTIDDAGVEEWLGLFMGADMVICNSFHGICFSLIFKKPFFVFLRNENDWRFTGICEEFGLMDRLLSKDDKIPDVCPAIDFTETDRMLSELRKKAVEWIERNIVRYAKGASANG